MRRKITCAAAGLLVLAVGGFLCFRALLRLGPGFQVTVNAVSVTNDPAGARHATFRVANSGRFDVCLVPTYSLENRTGQWRTNFMPKAAVTTGVYMMGTLPFHPGVKRLQPGESCTITLGLPFDDLGWRASFWYKKTYRPLLDEVNELSARIGLTKPEQILQVISTSWSDR